MENFINNIRLIDNAIMETKNQSILRNTKLIDKQLLTYFLYRIFCKNLDIFKDNLGNQKCDVILRALKIPTKFKKCSPLSNKMTNDIDIINSIFETLLDLFKELSDIQTKTGLLGNKQKIDYMNEFIEVQNDLEELKQNLILLSTLVPELGKMKSKSELNL